MARKSVFEMSFENVYQALVNKAERKGRTRAEVDEICRWLTGYEDLTALAGKTYGEFLREAPDWNPRSELIRGSICGVRVEEIEDETQRRMRQFDKLVDELAKGRPMEKVKR